MAALEVMYTVYRCVLGEMVELTISWDWCISFQFLAYYIDRGISLDTFNVL